MKLAALGVAALLAASPVLGGQAPIRQVLKEAGVPVYTGGATCAKDPNLLGQFKAARKSYIVICPSRHDSQDEEDATLRHEAWHLIQLCVGNKRGFGKSVTVGSFRKELPPEDAALYTPEKLQTEMEARWAETHYTDTEIANILRSKCS